MRKIKFRIWDNKWDEWLEPENHVIFADNGDVGEVNGNELVESVVHDTVVEQFTEFHDKNGQKIYEGDIVRFKDSQRTKVGVVTVGRYFIKVGDKILSRDFARCEVIGNIHENPELLEVRP